jgi:hypothetical protein
MPSESWLLLALSGELRRHRQAAGFLLVGQNERRRERDRWAEEGEGVVNLPLEHRENGPHAPRRRLQPDAEDDRLPPPPPPPRVSRELRQAGAVPRSAHAAHRLTRLKAARGTVHCMP